MYIEQYYNSVCFSTNLYNRVVYGLAGLVDLLCFRTRRMSVALVYVKITKATPNSRPRERAYHYRYNHYFSGLLRNFPPVRYRGFIIITVRNKKTSVIVTRIIPTNHT